MNSAHPADSAIFGHLWSTPEASALFSDEGRTQAWLQILAALAQAQAERRPGAARRRGRRSGRTPTSG